MSHFTVLVIGPDPEKQLAPFQENNMGNCPREYMEFVDVEEECRQDYETDTVRRVVMEDGRLVEPWDDAFRVPGTIGMGSGTHKVPAHLAEIEEPVKNIYTWEKYMDEYHGYKKDKESGRYGYWENPNKKWDWYVLGGRWTGFFKLKQGLIGQLGEVGVPALFTGETADIGTADQALKKEIDFEAKRDKAEAEALKTWDAYISLGAHDAPHRRWSDVRESIKDFDEARDFYWAQPRNKAIREASNNRKIRDILGWDASADDFDMTREEYLQAARDKAGVTFAVLDNGKWYERGQMGWFACVSDEKDQNVWNKEFQALVDNLSDDTLLSVYDCHI